MKQQIRACILVFVLALLLTGCGTNSPEQPGQAKTEENAVSSSKTQQYDKPPAMQIDPNKQYTALVSTTMGDFKIELFAKDAPKTVNNFVFLSKEKFYDNVIFHRIIQSYMIQTGDPAGNGTGGPGYTFEDELNNGHTYEPGVVAMANSGPNTNGSQFFIGTGPDITLLEQQPNYTIFGKVKEGMDVVLKIAAVPVKYNPLARENSAPEKTVSIKSITIEEN